MIAPVPTTAKSAIRYRTLRTNVAWTFLGNVVYAACQWATLVVLAWMGTKATVGEFALAMAVTAPVIMLANMQLRWVQATDSSRELDMRDCVMLRLVCIAMALPIVAMICVWSDYSRETTWIIMAVAIAKSIEAVCDVFYGWYQQHERMEFISYSLMIRGPVTVAVVAATFWWTQDLFAACASMAVTWMIILGVFDLPQTFKFSREVAGEAYFPRFNAKQLQRIFIRALPVGLTAGVVALQVNIPRYFVEHHMGKEELGVFAAMAYVLLAAETFIRAVNQSAMPRLSRYLADRNERGFREVVWKLAGIGTACGIVAVMMAMSVGKLFLKYVYGAGYDNQPGVLTLMIVGAAIAFVTRPSEVGLRSMRRFWCVLLVHAIGLPVFVGICAWLVPSYGLWGAAWAMLAQAVWHGVATVVIYSLWQPEFEPVVVLTEKLKGPHFLRPKKNRRSSHR